MTSKSDNKLSLPEEKENSIVTLEEITNSLPDLTPITESSNEDSDEDSSMPDLIEYPYDCCSSFGIDYKNILVETLDYNDEEIEKREERYENWKQNKKTLYTKPISPLFEEKR